MKMNIRLCARLVCKKKIYVYYAKCLCKRLYLSYILTFGDPSCSFSPYRDRGQSWVGCNMNWVQPGSINMSLFLNQAAWVGSFFFFLLCNTFWRFRVNVMPSHWTNTADWFLVTLHQVKGCKISCDANSFIAVSLATAASLTFWWGAVC